MANHEPPAKRICLDQPPAPDTSVPPLPPPLISALEEAYDSLYLVKPGSLCESYRKGLVLPRKDSYIKLVQALSQVPRYQGNIFAQQRKVDLIREVGVNAISINLSDNKADDFYHDIKPDITIISLKD